VTEPMEATAPPERTAALVAGLTIASRVMGLVRVMTATAVIGVTFLGNAYATANNVSNLLFELFAGGALAAALVPALTAASSEGNRQIQHRSVSAFANTALLVLTPIVVTAIVLRGPLMGWLTSGVQDPGTREAERRLGEFLLLFFLPQIWLYALGMVLTGFLHARRRFVGPALAPLLSSVVVTASYLIYAAVEGPSATDLFAISSTGRVILGAGTTAGVAVLSLSLLVPAARLGFRWRPVLYVPREAATGTGRLAASAAVSVGAQQILLAVVLVLANRVEGGVVAYQLAFTLLLLPWAVLAVPLATAAFPGLAESGRRDPETFAVRSASAMRTTLLAVFGGAAVMFAAARPASAAILALGMGSGGGNLDLLAPTVALFAPGLVGYGLFALLTRTCYALGDGRTPALAAVAGFGLAGVIDVGASAFLEGADLIAALAAGFTIGMTLSAVVLVGRLRARQGRGIFDGASISAARGAAAGIGGAALGWWVASAVPAATFAASVGGAALSAGAALIVYLGVQRLLGDREMGRTVAAIRGSR
jgi:putative peptidoglycan lipid II flippase